jgi:uncharacterized protein Smg (DUF494 family)
MTTTDSVLDILIYVFNRYMLHETPRVPQREDLARDLERAGFPRANVERAPESHEPDTEQLKWVVLMVLPSEPAGELAVERLGTLAAELRRHARH